ncbi:MAG: hypothetical protein QM754_05015 [Tepidisphaeraceae bacterium]
MPGPRGLGADETADIGVTERFFRAARLHDAVQQREGAVVEFHGDALKGFHGFFDRNFKQLEDDRLVRAEHRAFGDAEQQGVTDLAGGARDGDSNGLLHLRNPSWKKWTGYCGGPKVRCNTGGPVICDKPQVPYCCKEPRNLTGVKISQVLWKSVPILRFVPSRRGRRTDGVRLAGRKPHVAAGIVPAAEEGEAL